MYGYRKPRKSNRKMSATRRAYLAGVRAGKKSVRSKRTFRKKRWY